MKIYIFTNNPSVKNLNTDIRICYKDITLLEVLIEARDLIHKGHALLTHPLSGSVKPNETPYKSIILSEKPVKEDDYNSLAIIEKSILTVNKFNNISATPNWNESVLEDFQLIDFTLIQGAVSNIL